MMAGGSDGINAAGGVVLDAGVPAGTPAQPATNLTTTSAAGLAAAQVDDGLVLEGAGDAVGMAKVVNGRAARVADVAYALSLQCAGPGLQGRGRHRRGTLMSSAWPRSSSRSSQM